MLCAFCSRSESRAITSIDRRAARVGRRPKLACYAGVMFRDQSVSIHDEVTFEACATSWKEIDRALQKIAKRRSLLDAEEARWIREALRAEIWLELGMVSMLEYLEVRLGYGPRVAQDHDPENLILLCSGHHRAHHDAQQSCVALPSWRKDRNSFSSHSPHRWGRWGVLWTASMRSAT